MKVVDTIFRDGPDPLHAVVGLLLRGDVANDVAYRIDLKWVLKNVNVCRSGTAYVPSYKPLDALHPDAIKPAMKMSMFDGANIVGPFFEITDVPGDELEGWISWEVELPPPGCEFDLYAPPLVGLPDLNSSAFDPQAFNNSGHWEIAAFHL